MKQTLDDLDAAGRWKRFDTWQEFVRYAAAAHTPDGSWIYTVSDMMSAGHELVSSSQVDWMDWSPSSASALFGETRRKITPASPDLATAMTREAAIREAVGTYSRRQVAAFADYRAAGDRAWQDYQRAMHAADIAYDTEIAAAGAEYDSVVRRHA